MLIAITLAAVLAILTFIIHALGTTFLIDLLRKNEKSFRGRVGEFQVLTITALVLMLTHLVETSLWAVAYLYTVGREQIDGFADAFYFSIVTFTTLGYGDIVLVGHWRLLSACQAMTGLLIFGWSTALLFAVVQRIWKQRYGNGDDRDENDVIKQD